MCLYKPAKFKLRREKLNGKYEYVAWKVLLIKDDYLYTAYMEYLILHNRWLCATKQPLFYDMTHKIYTGGFHCFQTPKGALRFLECQPNEKHGRTAEYIICKVFVRDVLQQGKCGYSRTDGFLKKTNVVVAGQMYVPKESK